MDELFQALCLHGQTKCGAVFEAVFYNPAFPVTHGEVRDNSITSSVDSYIRHNLPISLDIEPSIQTLNQLYTGIGDALRDALTLLTGNSLVRFANLRIHFMQSRTIMSVYQIYNKEKFGMSDLTPHYQIKSFDDITAFVKTVVG